MMFIASTLRFGDATSGWHSLIPKTQRVLHFGATADTSNKRFWKGKLTKQVKKKLKEKHANFQTVVKYVDRNGKKRYHGSRQLTSTELLGALMYTRARVGKIVYNFGTCCKMLQVDQLWNCNSKELYQRVWNAHGKGSLAQHDQRPPACVENEPL